MLIGQEDDVDNGVLPRLIRHLAVLKTVTGYRPAFADNTDDVEWPTIAGFFAEAFEHGRTELTLHY